MSPPLFHRCFPILKIKLPKYTLFLSHIKLHITTFTLAQILRTLFENFFFGYRCLKSETKSDHNRHKSNKIEKKEKKF